MRASAARPPRRCACSASTRSTPPACCPPGGVPLPTPPPPAPPRLLARLGPQTDDVAHAAADAAANAMTEGLDALPSASSPLLDITAEQHAAWTARLFAS